MLNGGGTFDETRAGPDPSIPGDVRAEALDVVQDVIQWRLAEARWSAIEQTLTAMDTACQMGDREGLEAATVHLELAGPLRIVRIGATPILPPPPPIRDRLNRLVFALGGTTLAPQQQPSEDAGTDSDDHHRS
jgi:hypothetical protein